MKILFDENMPYAKEFFSEFCAADELVPFSGRYLTAQQVAGADVLLVRSITQVNEALLKDNTTLSFVGTATIGMDHIDQAYLAERNIAFHSAPGCNAISVAEYVISSLVVLAERYLFDLTKMTVGIVGGGNTGTQLSEKLTALGITYKVKNLNIYAYYKRYSVKFSESNSASKSVSTNNFGLPGLGISFEF